MDSTEKNVSRQKKAVPNRRCVNQRAGVHIYLAPKTMRPLMEPAVEANRAAASPLYASKKANVDSKMVFA